MSSIIINCSDFKFLMSKDFSTICLKEDPDQISTVGRDWLIWNFFYSTQIM